MVQFHLILFRIKYRQVLQVSRTKTINSNCWRHITCMGDSSG